MKKIYFIEAFVVFILLMGGVMLIDVQTERHFAPAAGQGPSAAVVEVNIPTPKIDPYRLNAPLPFVTERQDAESGWTMGKVIDEMAWLDHKTGMIWGSKLPDVSYTAVTTANARQARQVCKQRPPAGAWDLPTKDELQDARANGLIDIAPDGKHRWLSYKINDNYQLFPLGSAWGENLERVYYIRCIGYGLNDEKQK